MFCVRLSYLTPKRGCFRLGCKYVFVYDRRFNGRSIIDAAQCIKQESGRMVFFSAFAYKSLKILIRLLLPSLVPTVHLIRNPSQMVRRHVASVRSLRPPVNEAIDIRHEFTQLVAGFDHSLPALFVGFHGGWFSHRKPSAFQRK